MNEQDENTTAQVVVDDNEAIEALTAYFRKISRGRIVDLPRWAQ
jgi:hypothetical protein